MKFIALTAWASGWLLIGWWYHATRPSLARRIGPYLPGARSTSQSMSGQLLAPLRELATRLVGAAGSTATSIQSRQRALGETPDLGAFRTQQVTWATGGAAVMGLAIIIANRSLNPILAFILVAGAAFGAALACDGRLTQAVSKRREALAAQLPDTAELLALAVGAGEAIAPAIQRTRQVMAPPMSEVLGEVMDSHRLGTPLKDALEEVANTVASEPLTRLFSAVATAVERGTPLATVLHDQALDARDLRRRQLMEIAGKKEIAMLFPVVFLILPLTVILALFPGLIALRSGW